MNISAIHRLFDLILYYFQTLQQQAVDGLKIIKALALSRQGFFFVAGEGFEPPTFGL